MPDGYPSQLRSRSQGSDSLEPPSTSTWIITPADALSPPSSHQQKSISEKLPYHITLLFCLRLFPSIRTPEKCFLDVLPSYALTSNDAHDAPPPGVPPLPPFPTPYQASPAVAQPGNAIISQPNGPTEPLLSPPAGVVAGGAVSTVGLLPPYAMSKVLSTAKYKLIFLCTDVTSLRVLDWFRWDSSFWVHSTRVFQT